MLHSLKSRYSLIDIKLPASGFGYFVRQGLLVATEAKDMKVWMELHIAVYNAEIMRETTGLESVVNSPAVNLASGIIVQLEIMPRLVSWLTHTRPSHGNFKAYHDRFHVSMTKDFFCGHPKFSV